MLANADIRKTAKTKGVMLWEVAKDIGISEPTMTRKMRVELPAEEKQRIFKIIDRLAAAKQKEFVSERKNAANGATNTH